MVVEKGLVGITLLSLTAKPKGFICGKTPDLDLGLKKPVSEILARHLLPCLGNEQEGLAAVLMCSLRNLPKVFSREISGRP